MSEFKSPASLTSKTTLGILQEIYEPVLREQLNSEVKLLKAIDAARTPEERKRHKKAVKRLQKQHAKECDKKFVLWDFEEKCTKKRGHKGKWHEATFEVYRTHSTVVRWHNAAHSVGH